MMNLSDLSKKQKQYLVLGAIVAIVLAVLIVFVIKVSLSSISVAREELKGLTEKIESAEKSVSHKQRDEMEFSATIAELKEHLANMPPDQNYYSWVTELIYEEARKIHFEIDAINELNLATLSKTSGDSQTVEMRSYSLRISAHGGYGIIKQFLNQIDINHPLIRVTGIEIGKGSAPDVHSVQLFIEWPFNMGNIAEAWERFPALTREPPVEPTAASETVESDPENKPVPPLSRPSHAAPADSDGSMQSDIHIAGETNSHSRSKQNPTGDLKQ